MIDNSVISLFCFSKRFLAERCTITTLSLSLRTLARAGVMFGIKIMGKLTCLMHMNYSGVKNKINSGSTTTTWAHRSR